MVICPECGSPNSSESHYCVACGKTMTANATEAPVYRPQSTFQYGQSDLRPSKREAIASLVYGIISVSLVAAYLEVFILWRMFTSVEPLFGLSAAISGIIFVIPGVIFGIAGILKNKHAVKLGNAIKATVPLSISGIAAAGVFFVVCIYMIA